MSTGPFENHRPDETKITFFPVSVLKTKVREETWKLLHMKRLGKTLASEMHKRSNETKYWDVLSVTKIVNKM